MGNWRNNISDIEDLNDVDMVDNLIVIRHHMLSCATDLIKNGRDKTDVSFGENQLMAAIAIQEAIERCDYFNSLPSW